MKYEYQKEHKKLKQIIFALLIMWAIVLAYVIGLIIGGHA